MPHKYFYQRYFRRLPVRRVAEDEELLYLSPAERSRLKYVLNKTSIISGILCVLGYVFLFVPKYILGDYLFPINQFILFGQEINLSLSFLIYGWCLGFLEIWCLVFLNIWTIHEIAVATGFIHAENKSIHLSSLLSMSMEKKNKEVIKFGINPLEGLSKFSLFLFNLWLLIRGLLASMLIRVLVKKILGNYAFRMILDFSGLPLFVWLNIRGSRKVYQMGKVVLMGQHLVKDLTKRFDGSVNFTQEEKDLIYATLQYIAVSKRDFHPNHFVLTKEVLEKFNIPVKTTQHLPSHFEQQLLLATDDLKRICVSIIIAGFLLDGEISYRERNKLNQLNELGITSLTFEGLKKYKDSFLSGDGLKYEIEHLLAHHRLAAATVQ